MRACAGGVGFEGAEQPLTPPLPCCNCRRDLGRLNAYTALKRLRLFNYGMQEPLTWKWASLPVGVTCLQLSGMHRRVQKMLNACESRGGGASGWVAAVGGCMRPSRLLSVPPPAPCQLSPPPPAFLRSPPPAVPQLCSLRLFDVFDARHTPINLGHLTSLTHFSVEPTAPALAAPAESDADSDAGSEETDSTSLTSGSDDDWP